MFEKKLADLDAAIEAARTHLGMVVASKEVNLEQGYELLHKIQKWSQEKEKLEEILAAVEVLTKHGVAFKVFTEEDVYRRVDQLPYIKMADRRKIVQHVVEGDDWDTMTVESAEEDANIWAMIKGTAGDHPEWFSPEALRKL
jgi:cysteinyl-tRNA synthetase